MEGQNLCLCKSSFSQIFNLLGFCIFFNNFSLLSFCPVSRYELQWIISLSDMIDIVSILIHKDV